MKLRGAGDHAVLVELEDNAAVHALAALVGERLGELVEDVVPGHRTLLVSWPEGGDGGEVQRVLGAGAGALELAAAGGLGGAVGDDGGGAPGAAGGGAQVVITVSYDGPDLAGVAAAAGLAEEEVAAIHTAALYTAAFIGFAPGFAYLIGGDERLAVPRRQTPRVRVPAGAVALAGGYSAVYPTAGPGGWQIIGHTDAVLFDLARPQPALIVPGSRVRFEAI